MHFDHVALASYDALPALDVLVGELGGTVLQGAEAVGFRPVQVRVGDAARGMTVELLEPFRVDEDDFLERFLRARGAGPHHLTFKVDDLAAELERVRSYGIEPVGVFLDLDDWKEAFLPPKLAHGMVVQLAQVSVALPPLAERLRAARIDGPFGLPQWWPDPPPRNLSTATLDRIVISTPTLDDATHFFTELLGGAITSADTGAVDIEWPDGECVRLVRDEQRPPGIQHLEVSASGAPREIVLSGTPVLIQADSRPGAPR